jgi:hypothetical protein
VEKMRADGECARPLRPFEKARLLRGRCARAAVALARWSAEVKRRLDRSSCDEGRQELGIQSQACVLV